VGIQRSPSRKKKEAFRRKAQEAAWAARSGPVVVIRSKVVAPSEAGAISPSRGSGTKTERLS
jgi:uncharacterized protein YigE (DUF2233 family)